MKAKTLSISLVVLSAARRRAASRVVVEAQRPRAPTAPPRAQPAREVPAINVERVDEAARAASRPARCRGRAASSSKTVAAEGGVISGRVINWSTGDGVGDAELTFTRPRGAMTMRSEQGRRVRARAAEAPGMFSLTTIIAPGFLPYAPELEHSPVRIALAAKQAVRGVTLFLFPAVDYFGTVVDAQGAPVAGAHVKLADPPAGEQTLEKIVTEWTTDKQGKFVFHAPDGAVFEAIERRQARLGDARRQRRDSRSKMTIKIGDAPARDATIKGKTVDRSGAPIADVLVTAVPEDQPGKQTRAARGRVCDERSRWHVRARRPRPEGVRR